MLRIDKKTKTLIPLERKTMREAGYWERRDIQEMICTSPEPFCLELGEEIHFVGSEVYPTEFVKDRIDLLGIDNSGKAVIIELKRDSHKLHLLQTLAYAGMIAKWEPRQFVEQLQKFNKKDQTFEQAKEELEDVLNEGDIELINRAQRIVLLAEEFDYEVLVTAEWLTERYDMDISCYRLSLAKNGDADFLTCTSAYPPPEIAEIANRRRRKKAVGGEGSQDWEGVLESMNNPAERTFFRSELAANRDNSLENRTLTFRIDNKRRYRMAVRQTFAYVRQFGRFEADIDFWTNRLGQNAQVGTRNRDRDVKFRLWTEQDFNSFKNAFENDIPRKPLLAADDYSDEGEDELDDQT